MIHWRVEVRCGTYAPGTFYVSEDADNDCMPDLVAAARAAQAILVAHSTARPTDRIELVFTP